jgi:hypothetical protein
MSLDFSLVAVRPVVIFDTNITHNLGAMAAEAGIYDCLWRPDEHGFEYARDIIPTLHRGLADLKENPEHYKKFDASNGWGIYEHFVPFVEQVLQACEENPDAKIEVSR